MTAELVDEFAETITHIRRLHAKAVGIVSELNRARYANGVGYASLAPLLMAKTRISLKEARRYVNQAELIAEDLTPTGHVTPAPLPTAREALLEGVLDGEHVEVIGTVVTKLLPEHATTLDRELVESILTEQARVLDPTALRHLGTQIANHLNQDGREPEDPELAEPVNELRYQHTSDGRVKGTFSLDPETGEEFTGIITALSAPMPPAPGILDPRSKPERNGDAFAEVIHLAAKADDVPSQGGVKAAMSLVLDMNTLIDGLGVAVMDSGIPLCPEAARRIGCDADLIPIVLNTDGVPLDVGRTHRLVTPGQRTALIARDHGCAFPGCHLPPRWTDAHHVIHWKDGGPTDLANTVLLCKRHHRLIHHSAWEIRMTGGLPYFLPPSWLDPHR